MTKRPPPPRNVDTNTKIEIEVDSQLSIFPGIQASQSGSYKVRILSRRRFEAGKPFT
jgi:hypothetical protein